MFVEQSFVFLWFSPILAQCFTFCFKFSCVLYTTGRKNAQKKEAAAQTFCAAASGLQSFLQDAGADGVCHLKQVFLPDKAELGLVAVRKADCQLGRLQRVAKARRLDAVV